MQIVVRVFFFSFLFFLSLLNYFFRLESQEWYYWVRGY